MCWSSRRSPGRASRSPPARRWPPACRVITSDCLGPEEVVHDGVNGLDRPDRRCRCARRCDADRWSTTRALLDRLRTAARRRAGRRCARTLEHVDRLADRVCATPGIVGHTAAADAERGVRGRRRRRDRPVSGAPSARGARPSAVASPASPTTSTPSWLGSVADARRRGAATGAGHRADPRVDRALAGCRHAGRVRRRRPDRRPAMSSHDSRPSACDAAGGPRAVPRRRAPLPHDARALRRGDRVDAPGSPTRSRALTGLPVVVVPNGLGLVELRLAEQAAGHAARTGAERSGSPTSADPTATSPTST